MLQHNYLLFDLNFSTRSCNCFSFPFSNAVFRILECKFSKSKERWFILSLLRVNELLQT